MKCSIAVELPKNFSACDNKHLFKKIFSSENKTGGGEIEELIYMPENGKAIIKYKSDQVAQNVLSKKEIVYCDFTFKICACFDAFKPKESRDSPDLNMLLERTNLSLDLGRTQTTKKSSDTAFSEEQKKNMNMNSENCNFFDSNDPYKQLLLKNLTHNKKASDVERYAHILTNSYPISIFKKNDQLGIWLITFSTNLSIYNLYFRVCLYFFIDPKRAIRLKFKSVHFKSI